MSTTSPPVDVPQVPPGTAAGSRPALRLASMRRWVLMAPALAVMGLFAIALLDLLAWSFYASGKIGLPPSGEVGLQTYARIVTDPLYLSAILTTFRLSVIATIGSLVLGLPIAYWIVRTDSPRVRATLIILVAVPFMTSLIVRLYSLLLALGNSGLVNKMLQALGLIEENDFIALIRNELGVGIGLIYFVLPFVIFTLAGSFKRFDRTLEEAAQNLGADEVTTFFKVTLPLLAPGVVAAGTLAFVLAGTAFATPLILGGSAVRMVANVIYDQALFAQNMPVAAGLSVLALAFTIACLFVSGRISRWMRYA